MTDLSPSESVARRTLVTVWPFLLIVVILLAAMLVSLEIMSAVRAFVGGESMWSRGHKQAQGALVSYLRTGREGDYQRFLEGIAIPLADREARLALDEPEPDWALAYDGFVRGGLAPEDVPGMTRLYRYFGDTALMRDSVRAWRDGDEQILKLRAMGESIRQGIKAGTLNAGDEARYFSQLNVLNQQLTVLEEAFSEAMGKASRQVKTALTSLSVVLSLVMMTLGLLFARRLVEQRQKSMLDQQSESAKNQALLRNASDGIHVVDAEGFIIEASDSFCTMMGYERHEVIGMHLTRLEAKHDPEQIKAEMRKAIEGGQRVQLDTVHRHKNGELIDVELSAMPVMLQGQQLIFGSTRDIRARKQAEAELHESRNLLKTVIDHVPMRVFWKDRELRYLGCNPLFAHDAGKDHPAELVGRDDYEMAWCNEAEEYRADDQGVIDSGVSKINYEEPQTTPDGATRWLRTSKVPLTTVDDEVIGVLGIYDDISEQKRIQNELEKHRTGLEELVEARTSALLKAHQAIADTQYAMDKVGIGISWVDYETGRFSYCNAYAAEVLGYSVEEFMNLTVPDIDPNFSVEQYEEVRERIIQQGQIRFETEQRAKDGSLIPVEMTIYYQPEREGEAPRFIAFQTDITQRKQAEQSLREAKDIAESANQAKSEFLANMSHEIRTPMNGVIGMSEVLLKTALSDKQRAMAETIQDSAHTQLGILNDILDFSKIEAGKLHLSIEPFSLASVVEKTASILSGQASRKGVLLRNEVDSRIPPVLAGDALRLRQVLTNFTTNAIKFCSGLDDRTGEVLISARLIDAADAQVWVELAVRDNGIGMDEETLKRVFHPFIQADSTTTKRYGGTGLGLEISDRLVTAMGGGSVSTASRMWAAPSRYGCRWLGVSSHWRR